MVPPAVVGTGRVSLPRRHTRELSDTIGRNAFGRERALYGVQIEQPLAPPGRLAIGVSMARRTDHGELQQVDDFENSLALLFGGTCMRTRCRSHQLRGSAVKCLLLALALLSLATSAWGQALWSGILAPSRATDWTTASLPRSILGRPL